MFLLHLSDKSGIHPLLTGRFYQNVRLPLIKKYITGNNIAITANIIVKVTFKISSFFIVFLLYLFNKSWNNVSHQLSIHRYHVKQFFKHSNVVERLGLFRVAWIYLVLPVLHPFFREGFESLRLAGAGWPFFYLD